MPRPQPFDEFEFERMATLVARNPDCACPCHIPGSRVELTDDQPCCADMGSDRKRRKPYMVNRGPGIRMPRITAAAPKLYEKDIGQEQD